MQENRDAIRDTFAAKQGSCIQITTEMRLEFVASSRELLNGHSSFPIFSPNFASTALHTDTPRMYAWYAIFQGEYSPNFKIQIQRRHGLSFIEFSTEFNAFAVRSLLTIHGVYYRIIRTRNLLLRRETPRISQFLIHHDLANKNKNRVEFISSRKGIHL